MYYLIMTHPNDQEPLEAATGKLVDSFKSLTFIFETKSNFKIDSFLV